MKGKALKLFGWKFTGTVRSTATGLQVQIYVDWNLRVQVSFTLTIIHQLANPIE